MFDAAEEYHQKKETKEPPLKSQKTGTKIKLNIDDKWLPETKYISGPLEKGKATADQRKVLWDHLVSMEPV
jgi:hypothetical protein